MKNKKKSLQKDPGSNNSIRECKEKIELNEYFVCYCTLPIEHEGKHFNKLYTKIEIKLSKRCESRNLDNIQCGLPSGHIGSHSVSGNVTKSWL